jgi:WD40 repeat protein
MKYILLFFMTLITCLGASESVYAESDRSTDRVCSSSPLRMIKFSQNSEVVAFIAEHSQINIINLRNNQKKVIPIGKLMFSFDLNPNAEIIVISAINRSIETWTINGESLREIAKKNSAFFIKFISDTEFITLTLGILKNWNLNGELLASSQVGDEVRNMRATEAISPDLQIIALGSPDGEIQLWRQSGELIKKFTAKKNWSNKGWISYLTFSLNGKLIASGSSDGSSEIWNLYNSDVIELKGHSKQIFGISFTPDNLAVATGSADKTLKLWNLKGEIIHSYSGIDATVNSLDISKNGRLIAATTVDGKVHVWEISGKKVLTSQEVECYKP